MSVHYTEAVQEVVAAGTGLQDIDSEEWAVPFATSVGHSQLQVRNSVKVSVTYDVAQVDELAAA